MCLGSTASVQDEIRAMCQAAWISSVLTDRKPIAQQHSEPLTTFVHLLIRAHRGVGGLPCFLQHLLLFCFERQLGNCT